MSSRYDTRVNQFDQEGQLNQVQNAIKAIEKMGASIGILTNEGIVITCEKEEAQFLLEQERDSKKIYKIDDHLYTVVGGLLADSNYLINQARLTAARYRYKFENDIPMEQLVINICDIKQQYTHFGGKRPFGSSFLFAGYDKHHGYQMYSTDPSGNYAGWSAQAMGNNSLLANSMLKSEYNKNMSLNDSILLALKALVKTLDTTKPSGNKIEVLVLSKGDDNKVTGKSLSTQEVDDYLLKCGFNQEEQQ